MGAGEQEAAGVKRKARVSTALRRGEGAGGWEAGL